MAIIGIFFREGFTGPARGIWALDTAQPSRAFEKDIYEAFKRRLENEIEYGRIGMLAPTRYITPELTASSGQPEGHPFSAYLFLDQRDIEGALKRVKYVQNFVQLLSISTGPARLDGARRAARCGVTSEPGVAMEPELRPPPWPCPASAGGILHGAMGPYAHLSTKGAKGLRSDNSDRLWATVTVAGRTELRTSAVALQCAPV